MTNTEISRIPFKDIPQLSRTDRDYTDSPEIFLELIEHVPSMEGLQDAIEQRKRFATDRKTLVKTIEKQYARLGLDGSKGEALLSDEHFTVVTAHQPSLLTGPLYFIYKICSAINLSRQMNAESTATVVHPLFVLGGEDHDFEEMNHLRFFSKEFEWASSESGSVGRMSQSGLADVLSAVAEVLGDREHAVDLRSTIATCFDGQRSYGDAMHLFVCMLFRDTELIVLQMDDPALKAQFRHIMRDEILHQTTHDLVEQAQVKVEKLGYKPQAFVRDINLFYMDSGMRNRIERNETGFQVVDSELRFTEEEIIELINAHPERFSPNVNLRPLYQETVLPNLAYIGGGGELAYWIERKTQFAHFGIPFPVLIRRNSVLFIAKGNAKLRRSLEIAIPSLFQDPEHEVSEWVRQHAEHEVDISAEMTALDKALDDLTSKAQAIEPTFARKVEAFKVKTLKEVDHMGKRLVREEKARHEQEVAKIRKLYDKLFPNGSLQERYENFIPMYLQNGRSMFDTLIEHLDPLEPGFIVIEEN